MSWLKSIRKKYVRSPIRYLWWIGRAGKIPKRATMATPDVLELERYKVEQHQLGLAVSIAPLGMVLLGVGGLVHLEHWLDQFLLSFVVLSSFAAAFLRVCLVAVSRRRVRGLLEAMAANKSSIREYFTSLWVHALADALAILGFVCLIAHLLRVIWS